ncbi:GOLPH3/VPS74 family protein [Streptomyces sp. NRRL F-5123]|uniref:GOLPH3/VPS74 family protein n=1 Tax=Streptomyces sp. NRRL F-5123 TaxID=1463856 RepID=UPI0004E185A8|nr:GPP34 family phosphoprotein [Streptomyces sp. NRRL F-5123]
MTTPQDVLITSLDVPSSRPVESGDLSLVLAGAELIDLLGDGSVTLDGELVVPGLARTPADRLLVDAASALVRRPPYESAQDWLWRRGEGLAAVYLAVMEEAGQVARRHRRILPGRPGPATATDTPARRRAAERWRSGDPVLTVLAGALGIQPGPAAAPPEISDDSVEAVLVTVGDAVVELDAVRQRRRIEQAAFDNIWRGG